MIRLLSPFDSSTLVPSLDWIYGSQLHMLIHLHDLMLIHMYLFLDLPFTTWPFGKCLPLEAAMPEAVPAKQAKLDTWEICVQSPKHKLNRRSQEEATKTECKMLETSNSF